MNAPAPPVSTADRDRAVQILELLLAERRDIEAVVGHRFERRASLQLDRLIAAEELIRDYQREHT